MFSRTTLYDYRLTLSPAISEGPGVGRIFEHSQQMLIIGQSPYRWPPCRGVKSGPHLDSTSPAEHYFQCGARPTIPIGLPPGQLHGDKPAALLCFALVQAPLFKLALQGAQRQTVIPAKLVLSQTTRFKFKHQPLYLLTASSLSPRAFLVFSH